jgi:membrane protease YdiL (CAAX protease family)
MSTAPDEPSLAPPPRRKGVAWLAWLAILGLCGFIVYQQTQRTEAADKPGDPVDISSRIQQTTLRSIVGLQRVLKAADPKADRAKMAEQLEGMNTGPLLDRVRCIIVIAEVAGPEEGAKQLTALRELVETRKEVFLSGGQRVLLRGLDHVFADRLAKHFTLPNVSVLERELLKDRLGWFGELALHPPEVPEALQPTRAELLETAEQSGLAFMGMVALGLFLAVLAVVAFNVFLFKVLRGTLTLRFTTGRIGHGGVYAETFALWLGAFLGLAWLAGHFLDHIPSLLRSGGAMLASLVVLVWPALRGVPAHQIREDLGWSSDTNPLMDLWAGFIGYVANLPLVAVVMVLSALFLFPLLKPPVPDDGPDPFASPVYPSHPVVERLAGADWRDFLPVLLLAAVVAPIVEETMFRGVLYRNLREATNGWGRFASGLFSTLLSSFVFAVIHPQGYAAVPMLMSLACGFCFMREWRGALLPSIFAHSFNNATVTLLAFFLLS